MLRIVMDTAGDLAAGWEQEYQIDLIPINIIFNGKSYLQGIDLKYDDFYKMVASMGIVPTTSQPTPQQFIDFYRKIAQSGDTILSIHVTDKLSGTMASAIQAAEELKGEIKVIPFDSASGTLCMGMMCKEARLMERAGVSLDLILKRLEYIRKNMNLIFTLDTLKFAQMSGRIKYMQATLASLLQVKPIIELKEGIIEMGEKVRSRAKSIDLILDKMEKKVGGRKINAGVVHAHDPQAGAELLKKVVERFNCAEIALAEITITLVAHFGPGALGFIAYPVEE
jgi:DegV family protein with EDD domain